ncbi:MAG: hypothetical protein U1A22_12380 [Xanthomonadaceae bacterium]|nr:hypothetical protein [Xanthomonadaceae bacterium]
MSEHRSTPNDSQGGEASWLNRTVSALPDLATSGIALWVWFDPGQWRTALVGYAVLIMLVEFVLIHASGFFGVAGDSPGSAPLGRRAAIGLLGMYLVFVASFAWSFAEPLVFLGAAWLLLAKAWPLLVGTVGRPVASQAQRGMWAASTMYYLLAVGLTTVLPVPRLGITGNGAQYGMEGQSGLWVSQPQTAVVALAIYFGLVGLTRLMGWDRAWGRQAERSG